MLQSKNRTTSTFAIRPADTGVGAEVVGLDLGRALSDDVFNRITAAFNLYSMLAFRDQHLTPEQRIAFSRRFGPLQINVRSEFNNPAHPEI
jgi:taurine dioxygenase